MVRRRAAKLLMRGLAVLAVSSVLGIGYLAVRLSQGWVNVDFLTPYISDSINPPLRDFTFEIGHTVLAWDGHARSIDLRITEVRVLDKNMALVGSAPSLALSLVPRDLLRGKVVLRSIQVLEPHIKVLRDERGALSLGLWSEGPGGETLAAEESGAGRFASAPMQTPGFKGLINFLLAGMVPDPEPPPLSAIRIVNASLEIEDRVIGLTSELSHVSLEIASQENGLKIEALIDMGVGSKKKGFKAQGSYLFASRSFSLEVLFDDVVLPDLKSFLPSSGVLEALDLPLSGSARLYLKHGEDWSIRMVMATLNVVGGPGTLRLASPMSADYPVESLVAGFSAVQSAGLPFNVKLERAELRLRRPFDRTGEGPILVVGAEYGQSEEDATLTLVAEAKNVFFDDLSQFWPSTLAPSARGWVTENLSRGVVSQGWWRFALKGPSLAELRLEDLKGTASANGVSVSYVPSMPKVADVAATASFSSDALTLALSSGRVYDLRLPKGTVSLKNLTSSVPQAVVDLSVEGPLRDALTLVAQAPLKSKDLASLDLKSIGGTSKTGLAFSFPLLASLSFDEIKVRAKSLCEDVSLPQGPMGKPLTEGNLKLSLDNDGFDVKGAVRVSGVAADIAWREEFKKAPFQSRHVARARLSDQDRERLGLGVPDAVKPYFDLKGPVFIDAEITRKEEEKSDVVVNAVLDSAHVGLPAMAWDKPAGASARATVKLRLTKNGIGEISSFSFRGPGASVSGAAAFSKEGTLRRVKATAAPLGETRGEGVLERVKGGYALVLKGTMLDVRLVKTSESSDGASLGVKASSGAKRQNSSLLSVQGDFEQVRWSETGGIQGATFSAVRQEGQWQSAQAFGFIPRTAPAQPIPAVDEEQPAETSVLLRYRESDYASLSVRLGRIQGEEERSFSVLSDDAGAAAKAFGVIKTMRGGRLRILGKISSEGQAKGRMSITSYRLVDAPGLARVVSLASFVGILDALTGTGLAFSELDAPFVLEDKTLTFENGRMFGPALGLTGGGSIDLDKGLIDLTGTIVPIYMVNSILGNIPILGNAFSGFDAGGGVFASTYALHGPLSDPRVRVNPLSIMAPGFLRTLFRMDPVNPPKKKPESDEDE